MATWQVQAKSSRVPQTKSLSLYSPGLKSAATRIHYDTWSPAALNNTGFLGKPKGPGPPTWPLKANFDHAASPCPNTVHAVMSNSLEAKIVVLGSQGVGKTSLVHRYVKNAFTPPTTQSTIGASFLTKRVVDIDTSTVVRLQIWDTAGQERFRSISKLYYRGANAAVLCYDITDPQSFEEMGRWLKELKTNLGNDIILHVVGTKSDVVAQEPSRRKVPFERCIAYVAENLYPPQQTGQTQPSQANTWALAPTTTQNGGMASPQSNRSSGFWGQDIGWDCCHEISAKDGEGVDEVFRVITRKLVEQQQRKLEEEHQQYVMALNTPGIDGNGNVSGYFDYPGHVNGSFRVGLGDKRRSWLGFPTTPAVNGLQQEWEEDIDRAQKHQGGRCC